MHNKTFAIFTVHFGVIKAMWCHCQDNEKGLEPDVCRCKNDSFYHFKNGLSTNPCAGDLGAPPPQLFGRGGECPHGVSAYVDVKPR